MEKFLFQTSPARGVPPNPRNRANEATHDEAGDDVGAIVSVMYPELQLFTVACIMRQLICGAVATVALSLVVSRDRDNLDPPPDA